MFKPSSPPNAVRPVARPLDLRVTAAARAQAAAEAATVAARRRARTSALTATPDTARRRYSIGADIASPRRVARAAVQVAGAAAQATTAATRRAVAERPRVVTPHRRLNVVLELAQYPLIAAAALGAAYSSTIGQWLVFAYAVAALVMRRSSRLSFGTALFLLITVPFFQVLGQSGIAENAAIYAYELLVIGTIQALIELRKTGSSAKSSA